MTYKTYLLIICSLLIVNIAHSEEISISKANGVPDEVCNETEYKYEASLTGLDGNTEYSISWKVTNDNGEIISSSGLTSATVKWKADSEGNVGKLQAKLKVGDDVVATSNTIEVTIKSIKHLEPVITEYPTGGQLTISPCASNQKQLEVTRLVIPGTGDLNPTKVYDYEWFLPKGWTLNGQTSNGTDPILGDSYVTVYYPASATGGTIKVRGYVSVPFCGDVQRSKYSQSINVIRDVNSWNLTADKQSFICGDTDLITFTFTPSEPVPCAVYYWNNSTTATTSNTFQVTPGSSDVIVTVKAVYGGKTKNDSETVEMKLYDATNPPFISGPSLVCPDPYGSEYKVENVPAGASISWTQIRNPRCSDATENPITFTAHSTGYSYIEATLTTPCGSETLPQKRVWTGVDNYPQFDVYLNGSPAVYDLETGTSYEFVVLQRPEFDYIDYYWEVESPAGLPDYLLFPSSPVSFSAPQEGDYIVKLKCKNECGWGTVVTQSFYFHGSFVLNFSPNPSTTETTLSIESNTDQFSASKDDNFDYNQEWDMEVYSETMLLKEKKTKIKGKTTKIKTTGWKEGIYTVRVKYKDQILTGKLMVKK